MNHIKHHWRRTPSAIRKPFVFITGFAIVIVGIILLPLPGPGWVVIFLGFAILATEFRQAQLVRDWMYGIFTGVAKWCKEKLAELKSKR